MKTLKVFIIACFISIFGCASCVTAQDYGYEVYDNGNDVMVVDGTCYVYYNNPTTSFLNTLHIIDGAYYYWYDNRYVPCVFPYWDVWSPYRFFYYDNHRWAWRDRHPYNHMEYRRNHHWQDFRHHRRPMDKPRVGPQRPNNRGTAKPTQPRRNGGNNMGPRPNGHSRPNAVRPQQNPRPNNGGNHSQAPRQGGRRH